MAERVVSERVVCGRKGKERWNSPRLYSGSQCAAEASVGGRRRWVSFAVARLNRKTKSEKHVHVHIRRPNRYVAKIFTDTMFDHQ